MLVVPRLLAMMVMLPLLTIFAEIVGIVGGMYIAQIYAHISNESFINSMRFALPFGDVLRGPLEVARLRDHHRRDRLLQRAEDARRRGRRRQGDDQRGRHRDHPDLRLQLRALVPALQHDGRT